MEQKIKRVVFEYEDGTVKELTEEQDVVGWLKKIDDMCIFMGMRNINYKWEQHEWKIVKNATDIS